MRNFLPSLVALTGKSVIGSAPIFAQAAGGSSTAQLQQGFGTALGILFMFGFIWGVIKIWSGANAISKGDADGKMGIVPPPSPRFRGCCQRGHGRSAAFAPDLPRASTRNEFPPWDKIHPSMFAWMTISVPGSSAMPIYSIGPKTRSFVRQSTAPGK